MFSVLNRSHTQDTAAGHVQRVVVVCNSVGVDHPRNLLHVLRLGLARRGQLGLPLSQVQSVQILAAVRCTRFVSLASQSRSRTPIKEITLSTLITDSAHLVNFPCFMT